MGCSSSSYSIPRCCGMISSKTLASGQCAGPDEQPAVHRQAKGTAVSMPNFRLDQQTALVTGAASGIGRGIALGLAAAGANVACFDLPESALEEVCDEIIISGQGAIALPGD